MGFGFIHNGIFLAIIAHSLIGASLVWDKVLRRPETRNLLSYVFWLGFISVFGLVLMPFGFHMPSLTRHHPGICGRSSTSGSQLLLLRGA